MQANLIKEERVDNTVVYFTEIDGKYVDKSMSFNFREAEHFFHHILINGSLDPVRTVMETAHVSPSESNSRINSSIKSISIKQLVDKFCDGPATTYLDASAIAHCREQTTLEDLVQAVRAHIDVDDRAQAALFVMNLLDYEID